VLCVHAPLVVRVWWCSSTWGNAVLHRIAAPYPTLCPFHVKGVGPGEYLKTTGAHVDRVVSAQKLCVDVVALC
jgi:hypothetical protein